MIHRIDRISRIDSTGLKLTLRVEDDKIGLDDELTVHVTVENESDGPVRLKRDALMLQITAASRGVSPNGERDEIFCCQKNQYGFGTIKHQRIRATGHEKLAFTAEVPRGASREFSHVVKTDLLANEYELQILYRPREGTFPVPYILSPPVPLDVLGPSK